MTIHVNVERVTIQSMSTIGYGFGHDDQGRGITFAGDHRPMRMIGLQLHEGPVDVELEAYQVVNVDEPEDEYHDPTGRACALAGRKAAGHDAPGYCEACYRDALRSRGGHNHFDDRDARDDCPACGAAVEREGGDRVG